MRTIDCLGRLTLPIEFEETLGVGPGTDLKVPLNGDAIVLRKYEPGCVFGGEMVGVVVLKSRLICWKCLAEAGEGVTGNPSPSNIRTHQGQAASCVVIRPRTSL